MLDGSCCKNFFLLCNWLAFLSERPVRREDQIKLKLNYFDHFDRTCIPAEAEPKLNGSLCYPLVNFTHPFCQDHGVALPSYVYWDKTKYAVPHIAEVAGQKDRNHEGNMDYDIYKKLRGSKSYHELMYYYKINNATMEKCRPVFIIWFCRLYFPRCDRTQSVFKEQKLCRETCLQISHTCHKLFNVFLKFYLIQYPDARKFLFCELQPYRNAGDSPECWYFTELANFTGNMLTDLEIELMAISLFKIC